MSSSVIWSYVPASLDISIRLVDSAPVSGHGSNGGVGELVSCVVFADELVVMDFAFAGDECARVRQST